MPVKSATHSFFH